MVLAPVVMVTMSPIVVAVAGLVLLAVVVWRFESRYRHKPPDDRPRRSGE